MIRTTNDKEEPLPVNRNISPLDAVSQQWKALTVKLSVTPINLGIRNGPCSLAVIGKIQTLWIVTMTYLFCHAFSNSGVHHLPKLDKWTTKPIFFQFQLWHQPSKHFFLVEANHRVPLLWMLLLRCSKLNEPIYNSYPFTVPPLFETSPFLVLWVLSRNFKDHSGRRSCQMRVKAYSRSKQIWRRRHFYCGGHAGSTKSIHSSKKNTNEVFENWWTAHFTWKTWKKFSRPLSPRNEEEEECCEENKFGSIEKVVCDFLISVKKCAKLQSTEAWRRLQIFSSEVGRPLIIKELICIYFGMECRYSNNGNVTKWSFYNCRYMVHPTSNESDVVRCKPLL